MGLYENIKTISDKKGISINKLEKELNLPRSSIVKYNASVPSVEKVRRIADYLGVSVDEIINLDVRADGQLPWYLDDETAQIAQWIAENPDIKGLMYALKDLPADSARALAEIAKRMRGSNPDG